MIELENRVVVARSLGLVGGEGGGPRGILVVKEQFYIQVAVAVTRICTCDQMT